MADRQGIHIYGSVQFPDYCRLDARKKALIEDSSGLTRAVNGCNGCSDLRCFGHPVYSGDKTAFERKRVEGWMNKSGLSSDIGDDEDTSPVVASTSAIILRTEMIMPGSDRFHL